MRAFIQLKFDAARRVLDFHAAHPDPNPAALDSAARLHTLLDAIVAMLCDLRRQQEGARQAMEERIRTEHRVRSLLGALAHLVRVVARQAGVSDPPMPMPGPVPRHGPRAFLRDVPAAIAEASGHRELLLRYGMPAGLLAELEQGLTVFREAESRRERCLATCLGATSAIESSVDQAYDVVRHLDALNRIRFAADPALLAAWRSARVIPWGRAADAAAPDPDPLTAA